MLCWVAVTVKLAADLNTLLRKAPRTLGLSFVSEGGKFLRKLWCCVGGKVTSELKTLIGHRGVKRLTFRALALRQSDPTKG